MHGQDQHQRSPGEVLRGRRHPAPRPSSSSATDGPQRSGWAPSATSSFSRPSRRPRTSTSSTPPSRKKATTFPGTRSGPISAGHGPVSDRGRPGRCQPMRAGGERGQLRSTWHRASAVRVAVSSVPVAVVLPGSRTCRPVPARHPMCRTMSDRMPAQSRVVGGRGARISLVRREVRWSGGRFAGQAGGSLVRREVRWSGGRFAGQAGWWRFEVAIPSAWAASRRSQSPAATTTSPSWTSQADARWTAS